MTPDNQRLKIKNMNLEHTNHEGSEVNIRFTSL